MLNKERQSNVELLKVIAMFFICISHVVNVKVYGTPNYGINPNHIVFTIFKNLGWLGDYIFIASSAYYLVGYKKLNLRKIILYYLDVFFLFICYFCVFKLIGIEGTNNYVFLTFTSLIVFDYWFVYNYLIFLIFLPLLTRLIEKLPQNVHSILRHAVFWMFLLILVISQFDISVYWTRPLIFVSMLIIMSYGKKYGEYLIFKEDDKKGLSIGLVCSIIYVIIANFVGEYLGYYGYSFIDTSTSICNISCPIWMVFGITLFLLFKNLKVKQSKFINCLSSLSLIFYVAHHNQYVTLIAEPLLNHHLEMFPGCQITMMVLFAILRYIFGLVVAFCFYQTIHKLLKILTSIQTKKSVTN